MEINNTFLRFCVLFFFFFFFFFLLCFFFWFSILLAINVIRDHPDNYDPEFETVLQKLIDRLEPKADAAAD